jgi:hypothetical protein
MSDINDPKQWRNIFLDVEKEKDVYIRPQGKVNVARSNFLRKGNEDFIEACEKAAKKRSKSKKWLDSIENRKIDYQAMDRTKTKQVQSSKCETPWGKFNSVKEAAIAGNIKEEKLRHKLMMQEEGYWKENKHSGKKFFSKAIHTPFGQFESAAEAHRYAIKNEIMPNARKKIQKYLKTDPENYYYVESNSVTKKK